VSAGVSLKKPREESRAERALAKFHDEEELQRVYDLRLTVRLLPYIRPHRRLLGASLLLLVVMSCLGLVRPLIMRAALQGFQEPGGQARIIHYGFALAGAILFEQLLAFPQMVWMQTAGARAMADLRLSVFRFLHTRSLGFFDTRPIGRLVTRVTSDVDSIGEMFGSGALNAVGDLVRLVAIVSIMLTLDWRMSLFAFVLVPPIAFFVNFTRGRMRTAYRLVRSKTARMNAYLNEQVSGIAVVQAYAREARSQTEFDVINGDYRSANMRAIVIESTVDAAIEMIGSVCIASILWYAGSRARAAGIGVPEIEFGTLFAFIAYIDMFFGPIRDLSARYTLVQSALSGAERIFQLLDTTEGDTGEAGAVSVDPGDAWPKGEEVAFELDGVTFAYKAGTPVLHDVGLFARRGETIALVGPTGSGKSTVASLLLRLYEAQEGEVRVFGRAVKDLDRTRLRRQFAVVPQDVFLFPGSVASNVAGGSPTFDRARVEQVLASIGALELFERRPEGIDAAVAERGSNFSAGERQLIALARALYRDPAILVLDEPTANIDSDTERRLQQAMDAAARGRTALIIAHRLSTIRNADRIVVLARGRVSETGTHAELIEKGGVYARLYQLQDARRAIERRVEEKLEALVANA
jgi:ATP-binding cassette subfamily B multidrug efflux pump